MNLKAWIYPTEFFFPKWRCTDNLDLKVPKIKDWEHYHLVKDMVEWRENGK